VLLGPAVHGANDLHSIPIQGEHSLASRASKKEANRAAELNALAQAGVITDLEQQVKFELVPKDELGRAIHYIADFVYRLDGRHNRGRCERFPHASLQIEEKADVVP